MVQDVGVQSKQLKRSMPSSNKTQLLVSVRDRVEAQLALHSGVDWVDLKDPAAGPLGAPALETASGVKDTLGESVQTSVALGELSDSLEREVCPSQSDWWLHARKLAGYFSVLKTGLSGLGNTDWRGLMSELRDDLAHLGRVAELVPVAYADYERCNAPPICDVAAWAMNSRSKYLLVDTFVKDGKGLLEWCSLDFLGELVEQIASSQVRLVVAGSIRSEDVHKLLKFPFHSLAVRGAVCSTSRNGPICPDRLSRLVTMVSNRTGAAEQQLS